MTDERFTQITRLAENAAHSVLRSGPISARPTKRRSGTRSKKASAVSIVGDTGRFQTQVSRIRPAETAHARRLVS